LVALGAPRTGVLVAVESAGVPLSLPHLLGAVGVAAAVGFVAVPFVGDRYLVAVGRLDPVRLSVAVLVGLAVLSWLFAGSIGVAAYVGAAIVGLVPARFGARRANLMGVLIGPLVVG
jgi:putative membrane protein